MQNLQSSDALDIISAINAASESEWPRIVHDLRMNKRLHPLVCDMNKLLRNPQHRDTIVAALQRMGLWAAA